LKDLFEILKRRGAIELLRRRESRGSRKSGSRASRMERGICSQAVATAMPYWKERERCQEQKHRRRCPGTQGRQRFAVCTTREQVSSGVLCKRKCLDCSTEAKKGSQANASTKRHSKTVTRTRRYTRRACSRGASEVTLQGEPRWELYGPRDKKSPTLHQKLAGTAINSQTTAREKMIRYVEFIAKLQGMYAK